VVEFEGLLLFHEFVSIQLVLSSNWREGVTSSHHHKACASEARISYARHGWFSQLILIPASNPFSAASVKQPKGWNKTLSDMPAVHGRENHGSFFGDD